MSSVLVEGTVFAGRYRVVRRIAAGGMGAVYEVVHLETERRRALKVMLPHVLHSAELRERFQREAKVAAHVESEFIVDVFDAGFDEATSMPFLVMELLRGEELGKRLKRTVRLAPDEVVTILHQTSLALDKTHRASIVHRDLKPENLFLTEREDGPPRVKVLDFGIAKVIAESTTAGATQSIGTPTYMAPEQFNPHARLTGAADRYALAMVGFTLLVGSAYWAEELRAGNVFALAAVAIHGPREPATARAARAGVALPASFAAWFQRATAVDPAQRFPTAVEMVAALAQALGVPPPGRAAMSSVNELTGTPFVQIAPAIPAAAAAIPVAAATSRGGTLHLPRVMPSTVPAAPAAFPAADPTTVAAREPAQITGPATVATGPVPARRRTGLALGVAGAAVALLGIGAYAVSRTSAARPSAPRAPPAASADPPPGAAPGPTAVAVTVELGGVAPPPGASAAVQPTASSPVAPLSPDKPAATAKPTASAGPSPIKKRIYTRE